MVKRIKNTSPRAPRIKHVGPKAKRISPEEFAKALGAEPADFKTFHQRLGGFGKSVRLVPTSLSHFIKLQCRQILSWFNK